MLHIELSNEERLLLRDYFKTSSIVLIRNKAQAIIMRSQDMFIREIASALFVGERTVERWIRDFSDKRMASIFSGLVGNQNAAKLTRKQKLEIKKILQQKPSDYGLPKEFWDVPQLKKYIYARFGEVYESDKSYHFLLEFGNLSFKYPDKFNSRRNAIQIASRMEEIYGEILPMMEDSGWEVFCSDEVRMVLEAITRKAWLKKEQKTIIKVTRSDDYQNYLGFLSQKTFKCHVFEIAWAKAPEIMKATAEFIKLYPNKKICIIWDNAKCHKGKLMQQALSEGGLLQKVHLISLPPYAPDCNPIEHAWKITKDSLSNHQSDNFDQTKQRFLALTNGKIFPYQI